MADQHEDPFSGGGSTKALTFKDAPVGTYFTGKVLERPQLVQARNYEDSKPAFWPDGNPKMTAVIRLEVNGEERSLWAAKPSAMFVAIKEAQEKSGKLIEPGGELTIKFTGEKPHDNPRFHAVKQYAALYKPPADDPFNNADEPPF